MGDVFQHFLDEVVFIMAQRWIGEILARGAVNGAIRGL
jgi:hypothetical protein